MSENRRDPAFTSDEAVYVLGKAMKAAMCWGVTSDPNSARDNVERAVDGARYDVMAHKREMAGGLVALMNKPSISGTTIRKLTVKKDRVCLAEEETVSLMGCMPLDEVSYLIMTTDGRSFVGKLVCQTKEECLNTKLFFAVSEMIPTEGSQLTKFIPGFFNNSDGKIEIMKWLFDKNPGTVRMCEKMDSVLNSWFMTEVRFHKMTEGQYCTTMVQVFE